MPFLKKKILAVAFSWAPPILDMLRENLKQGNHLAIVLKKIQAAAGLEFSRPPGNQDFGSIFQKLSPEDVNSRGQTSTRITENVFHNLKKKTYFTLIGFFTVP